MKVVNNKQQFRYEIALDSGEYAYLGYRWLKGDIVLMHTFVPAEERGKGIAAVLVNGVFEDIRRQGLKAIVYCPYIAEYIKTHHEYDDLIVKP